MLFNSYAFAVFLPIVLLVYYALSFRRQNLWLRDYLYIPLGGNRLGPSRTYVNLLTTMFLGGLWHGANWTFVIWGLLHGACLAASFR